MILGLSGKKGSGKDTVADYLCERYDFVKYGFGDPIKEVARTMFNFSESQLYGSDKETVDPNWGISPREFFQKFGTDYGQFIFPEHFPNLFKDIQPREFWVKRFLVWYLEQLEKNPQIKVVISDVRFIHEFNFIKKNNGYVIKIKRDLMDEDRHLSENELDNMEDSDFNGIINNNGSLEDLYRKVKNIIN